MTSASGSRISFAGWVEPVIVADTGAILALIDADDAHHEVLRALYEEDPEAWLTPWAVLPEAGYLLMTHVGVRDDRDFCPATCPERP